MFAPGLRHDKSWRDQTTYTPEPRLPPRGRRARRRSTSSWWDGLKTRLFTRKKPKHKVSVGWLSLSVRRPRRSKMECRSPSSARSFLLLLLLLPQVCPAEPVRRGTEGLAHRWAGVSGKWSCRCGAARGRSGSRVSSSHWLRRAVNCTYKTNAAVTSPPSRVGWRQQDRFSFGAGGFRNDLIWPLALCWHVLFFKLSSSKLIKQHDKKPFIWMNTFG